MVAPGTTSEVGSMLSVAQVAERLNVSTATVHRLIESRELAHIRFGVRMIRIAEDALGEFLAASTVRRLR